MQPFSIKLAFLKIESLLSILAQILSNSFHFESLKRSVKLMSLYNQIQINNRQLLMLSLNLLYALSKILSLYIMRDVSPLYKFLIGLYTDKLLIMQECSYFIHKLIASSKFSLFKLLNSSKFSQFTLML